MKKITCNCGTELPSYTPDGRQRSKCPVCLESIDVSLIPSPIADPQEKLEKSNLQVADEPKNAIPSTAVDAENQNIERQEIRPAPELKRDANRLGIVSLVLSLIALSLATCSSTIINNLQVRKKPDREYETHDLRVISDKATNVITFVEQSVVFLVGGLICGTISLIAFTLGCVALVRPPRLTGAVGVILSLIAFKVLLSGFN